MTHFEEAFTSHNWIVRIYRLKKQRNTDIIDYENTYNPEDAQFLSGIDAKYLDERVSSPIESLYDEKLFIEDELDEYFGNIEDLEYDKF